MKKVLAIILSVAMMCSVTGCQFIEEARQSAARLTNETTAEETAEAETAVVETTAETEVPTEAETTAPVKPERERPYIAVIARDDDTDFWLSVQEGIADAAEDYEVDYSYQVPDTPFASFQLSRIVKAEVEEYPDAFVVSPIDYRDVYASMKKSSKLDIPFIVMDAGIDTDEKGFASAYVGIDCYEAGKQAADFLLNDKYVMKKLSTGTAEKPVYIGCLVEDAETESNVDKVVGFIEEAEKICSAYGKVKVEGHDVWSNPVNGAEIVIEIAVAEEEEEAGKNQEIMASTEVLCRLDGILGIFCTTQNCVDGLISYHEGDAEAAKILDKIPVYGFESGEAQIKAIKSGLIQAAFAQDAYQLGYAAMEQAALAAAGEEYGTVVLPYTIYDKENVDDPDLSNVIKK